MRYKSSLVIPVALLLLPAACGDKQTAPSPGPVQSLAVPASAGSRSPNLAEGPDGTLLLSWMEPAGDGHALFYSEFSGAAWSAPLEVARGANWFVNWADFPSVVPVSAHLFAAHWLVSQPAGGYAYDVFVSLSGDRGATWSAPQRPHRDGTPTEHGFVSIYPHADGAGMIWLDGRKTAEKPPHAGEIMGMTLRSAVIRPDLTIQDEQEVDGLICDCCQTDVGITAAGPVAVYRDRTAGEVRDIFVSRASGKDWDEGRPIARDQWNIAACPVNGPTISASGQDLAVAWFTATGGKPVVRLAFSGDAGETFFAPIDIAVGNVFGRVGVATLSPGTAIVSWLGKTGERQAEISVARVTADGIVGTPVILAKGQTISGFSVPQIVLVNGQLLMAWTADTEGESRVQSALIPLSLFDPPI